MRYSVLPFVCALTFAANTVHAAQLVNLYHQPISALSKMLNLSSDAISYQSTETDFKQQKHIRWQQTYLGYPVYSAEGVLHIPAKSDALSAKLTGKIYLNLNRDLPNRSAILNKFSTQAMIQQAKKLFKKRMPKLVISADETSQLIVYIDTQQKAHWAYKIEFSAKASAELPARPIYIMDALTGYTYRYWNNLPTLENTDGGGYGGNQKIGRISYDAFPQNLPKLAVQRDAEEKLCYLQNDAVIVKDDRHNKSVYNFSCLHKLPEHNNVFWDASSDEINGAFSPAHDALYVGGIVKDMYQDWYQLPVLINSQHKPMQLEMIVHKNMENAYWNGGQMVFGDGGEFFYPLVSLGVGAHEISHGFTEQHANLEYTSQSGGINEAFSDMAAMAAEFYTTGNNSWVLGAEITKIDEALRYMAEPTRDCLPEDRPGDDCSISNAKDYREDLDVHFSSGVFNKLFYLLSNSPQWDTRKAFNIMVQANRNYWTSTDNFEAAACALKDAAIDYDYPLTYLNAAIAEVGIKLRWC